MSWHTEGCTGVIESNQQTMVAKRIIRTPKESVLGPT